MLASGQFDYYTAIDEVRTKHCLKAIETLSQTKYLHNMWVDILKIKFSLEQNPTEKSQLEEDLKYAELFVPNSYSDYGDPEPSKKEVEKQPTGHLGYNEGILSPSGDLKLVGNQMYEQVCVNTACVKVDCKEANHMGWVEYDPDLDKSLWD